VPEAGFEVTLLPGRGIQRRLTAENIGAGAGIAVACWRSLGVLRSRCPAVVVTVGGYAGFPAAFAALLERIPVVVVSYDAVPVLPTGSSGGLLLPMPSPFPVATCRTPASRGPRCGHGCSPSIAALSPRSRL